MIDIFNLSIEDAIIDNVTCLTSYQEHKPGVDEILNGKEANLNEELKVED